MKTIFGLYLTSGQLLIQEESDLSLTVWGNKKVRKLLKYKRTKPEVKAALSDGHYLAGWDNYDSCLEAHRANMPEISRRVFR